MYAGITVLITRTYGTFIRIYPYCCYVFLLSTAGDSSKYLKSSDKDEYKTHSHSLTQAQIVLPNTGATHNAHARKWCLETQ